MYLPNVVIAGAPKCGTSSLFNWLIDHPEVCGSSTKETFYLMDEGSPLRRAEANYQVHGLAGYVQYFNHCKPCHKVRVEATTHYMYQQTAPEVLSLLDPRPTVIFLLRNPAERVYSSFMYTKYMLANVKGDLTFAEYVHGVRTGMSEKQAVDLFAASGYVLKRDTQYSQYIEYLLDWRSRLGKEHMRVLLFEDMKQNPQYFMVRLAEDLNIDPAFYHQYSFFRKNKTHRIRNRRIHRWARAVSHWMPRNALRNYLRRAYLVLQIDNTRAKKDQEDQTALNELSQHFEPFNRRLEKAFSLDLASWR